MEDEHVVTRADGDQVVVRVPGGVQAFLVEVEVVGVDVLASRVAASLRLVPRVLADAGRLEDGRILALRFVHREEVAVRASQHEVSSRAEIALEFVKNAIVFVKIAEF